MSDGNVWYQDGLRFECTQCGNCCTGAPGYVWVNDAEVEAIAKHFGKSVGEARIEYTRKEGRQTTLKEYANGDCVFFDGATRRCTIYTLRPRQCRTWPFWNSNLESPETWEEVKTTCPGTGVGPLYQLEHIQKQAAVIDI